MNKKLEARIARLERAMSRKMSDFLEMSQKCLQLR